MSIGGPHEVLPSVPRAFERRCRVDCAPQPLVLLLAGFAIGTPP